MHEEEHHTEQEAGNSEDELIQDGLYNEAVAVSAVLTKHQYKTYISSLVRLLVGEQLQLKWIKKGPILVTKDFHLFMSNVHAF